MTGFSKSQWGTLHLTWASFFLTFVAWFNMAPFNTTIMRSLGLSSAEIDVLMICNVALTIPARIIIGYWVDNSYTHGNGRWLIAASMAPGIIFGLWSAVSVEITG